MTYLMHDAESNPDASSARLSAPALGRSVVCCSLCPRGLSPSRPLCPWGSPGKRAAIPPPGDLPNPGLSATSVVISPGECFHSCKSNWYSYSHFMRHIMG